METIKLQVPHELPGGTYPAVWMGRSLIVEAHGVGVSLPTELGHKGRREGQVIIAGHDRMSVQFTSELG